MCPVHPHMSAGRDFFDRLEPESPARKITVFVVGRSGQPAEDPSGTKGDAQRTASIGGGIDRTARFWYTFRINMKNMNLGRYAMSMPKGKYIFGTVKVGERGQIVIPKEAREIFNIHAGDTLLVLGDEEQGIAVVKADVMQELAVKILKGLGRLTDGLEEETMGN